MKVQLVGKSVEVCSLNKMNIESYLTVYKNASAFADMYKEMPEFWDSTEKEIRESFLLEKDKVLRCLIKRNSPEGIVGYINVTYDSIEEPEIEIAIIEDQRKKGYATEASKLLIEYILSDPNVKCVVWSAFLSNTASRKIVEALGGKPIDRRNFVKEALQTAGFDLKSLEEKDIPKTIAYCISRR